jgi:hypothetical protein
MNQQPAQISSSPSVFARQEEKYFLGEGVQEKLLFLLKDFLELDGQGPTLISNIYLDTPDNLLIRRSIETPDFKEKLRIRTYGNILDEAHPAFLELKKKYLGTVYKRRVKMTLHEALNFVEEGIVPLSPYQGDPAKIALNRQIMDEIQWTLEHYGSLRPSISVTYERSAYTYTEQGASLRLTLDTNLQWTCRHNDNNRSNTQAFDWIPRSAQDDGIGLTQRRLLSTLPSVTPAPSLLIPQNTSLMEIKTSSPLPLDFSRVINELKLYPQSFSKVGRAYEALINKGENQ